jgi:hypothetical protein
LNLSVVIALSAPFFSNYFSLQCGGMSWLYAIIVSKFEERQQSSLAAFRAISCYFKIVTGASVTFALGQRRRMGCGAPHCGVV